MARRPRVFAAGGGARGRLTAVGARPALAGVGLAALATLAFSVRLAPRDAVPSWLALLALSGGLLAASGWWLARGSGLGARALTPWILGGALALRLAALAAPVSLSDDVHRYAWDGALLARGEDPFAARPREVVGRPGLPASELARLNSPDYYSVYPPLAQLAFGVGGAARRVGLDAATTLRALFVAAELSGIAALLGLLRRLERPAGWALLYAWNPVVAWEVAGGGHTEALMLPLLLFAVCAALDDRARRAGVLLGLAASAKLTALIAGPVLFVFVLRRVGLARAAGFAGLALAVFALGWVPFASPTLWPHVSESLALYSERFSFNAPIYYGARHLLGYREGVTPPVDHLVVPWLTLASLSAIGGLALRQDERPRRLVGALGWTFAAHVLLSRVAHPWYLLPAMAFGAATRSAPLIAIGTLSALSYLRYHPLGHESPWVMAAEWVPFAALIANAARRARE